MSLPLYGLRFQPTSAWIRGFLLALATVAYLFSQGACVNVKAPDSIIIGGRQTESVASDRVPRITTVEEGRVELDKAYRSLRRIEDQNRELTQVNDALKRERDDLKNRIDRRD